MANKISDLIHCIVLNNKPYFSVSIKNKANYFLA